MRFMYIGMVMGMMGLYFFACTEAAPKNPLIKITAPTMGTTYNVVYIDSLERNFQTSIDSLLAAYDDELSTYKDSSLISKFNNGKGVILYPNGLATKATPENPNPRFGEHFERVFLTSQRIYKETNGWFNPTVKPLVNYWGFGYKEKRPIENADPKVVDSLLQLVKMDSILYIAFGNGKTSISKTDSRIQLDFNAIAPGDAVDEICKLLDAHNVHNYLVEIGGEVRAKGKSSKTSAWRVGINTPMPNVSTSDIKRIIEVKDRALATSGNYRSFYEKDGKKYVHTINPKTGYTEQNSLLSVTVLAPTCAEADAYATSFMAMGLDSSLVRAQAFTNIDVYLIYSDSLGNLKEQYSEGIAEFFK